MNINWESCVVIKMEMEKTKIYDTEELHEAYILDEILEISEILKERGYNPINQIVGYLISGDLGYITSYKEARQRIMQFDRIRILEVMMKKCLDI